jgi:hypothetical protein
MGFRVVPAHDAFYAGNNRRKKDARRGLLLQLNKGQK